MITYINDTSAKRSKAVRACTIRLLNLGHAKYEKVAIYAVNQRISNIWRITGAAELGRNPKYQMSGKRPFDTHIILWIDLKNILTEYKEKK